MQRTSVAAVEGVLHVAGMRNQDQPAELRRPRNRACECVLVLDQREGPLDDGPDIDLVKMKVVEQLLTRHLLQAGEVAISSATSRARSAYRDPRCRRQRRSAVRSDHGSCPPAVTSEQIAAARLRRAADVCFGGSSVTPSCRTCHGRDSSVREDFSVSCSSAASRGLAAQVTRVHCRDVARESRCRADWSIFPIKRPSRSLFNGSRECTRRTSLRPGQELQSAIGPFPQQG